MSLFKSKFAKLEAFASAKADERTPEMLSAAQDELNRASAGIILVPQTEAIKTGADLDNHITTLENTATTATAAAKTAQDALAEIKGQRVLGTQTTTSDKGTGGDKGEPTTEEKEAAAVLASAKEKPYTQRVMRMLNN